ncbi:MAG: hypothetical protein IJF13_04455 [Clostridia bacterium]|nr:hypothetical protein [Clostridia bacterium]
MNKKEREALINSQLDKHPEFQYAEKTVFILIILFVAVRVLPAVLQTVCVYSLGLTKTDCLMNYIMVILSALFAVMIAQGVKFFVILGALCGGYSLISLILDIRLPGGAEVPSSPLYFVYVAVLVAVCLIQIGIMLYMLFSKKIGEYLRLLDGVSKGYFDSGDAYM